MSKVYRFKQLITPRFLSLFLILPTSVSCAQPPEQTRTEVIYGRKDGMALTLDVFTPPQPNGVGILWIVSGGWFSAHERMDPSFFQTLLHHGYTVFAVVHGSQPRFSIADALADVQYATRFIRLHAQEYGIDAERLGAMGFSAGGHLSLLLGLLEVPGDPQAADPVKRTASKVRAVVSLAGPSDFLNYGKLGQRAREVLLNYRAAFAFQTYDEATKSYAPVTDSKEVHTKDEYTSPITHVTPGDAATLLFHGDSDAVVPFQQSDSLATRLKEAGVPVELIAKPGVGHDLSATWKDIMTRSTDWFAEHLLQSQRHD